MHAAMKKASVSGWLLNPVGEQGIEPLNTVSLVNPCSLHLAAPL